MADRIHPTEAINAPSPAAPSRAQQVPKKQPDVIFQVPKDVVYKVPQRNYSWPKSHRRRSPCCCCLAWLCSLLVSFVILVVVAAAVLYFVLRPRVPKYSVQNVQIRQFNSTADSRGETHLDSNVLFTITARNPNKKIGIHYREVNATVFYEDVQIGSGSVVPFYQGHKNTTILDVPLRGEHVLLKQDVASTLKKAHAAGSGISLRIHTAASIKLKLGTWNVPVHLKVRVTCDVGVTSPWKVGSATLESKSCKFKLKV